MRDGDVAESNLAARQALLDPIFLRELRLQMLKFASLQLSDAALAEDAVQEALIGALKNAASFGGHAALRTWVFAILKNKIADILRQRHRLAGMSETVECSDAHREPEGLFDRRGMWEAAAKPSSWGNPEADLLDQEFWRVLDACLNHLPPQQARVFMMREIVGMTTAEICSEGGISVSNLNVMLYRARLRLRECLHNNWFAPGYTKC